MRIEVASEAIMGSKNDVLIDASSGKKRKGGEMVVRWSLRIYDDYGNLISAPAVEEHVNLDEFNDDNEALTEARKRLKAKLEQVRERVKRRLAERKAGMRWLDEFAD